MKELELIITEGEKANGNAHNVEIGIPVRDPVERDGDQFIVLSARCQNIVQLEMEIKSAHHKLEELRVVAKANFRRWERDAKDEKPPL